VRTIRFGRTEAQIPAVSLGTWSYGGLNTAGKRSVGWRGHDEDKARDALVAAHAAGITHWDTADVYGDGRSEQLIGGVWKTVPRDEVFVATKVGWGPAEHGHAYHPKHIREQLETSLTNLGVEAVDLYYFHHANFGDDDAYLDDAVATVHTLRDEGKLRFVGLSDWFSEKIMKVIAKVDPDAVQPYRNVVNDTYASSGLKGWCDEHDVGVAFFSPIRHGLLLGKYAEPTTFEEGDFRANVPEFGDAEALDNYRAKRDALRERFGDSAQPVLRALLGALLADAPTGTVLLGQRNPEQVAAGADAGAALSAEDAAWVLELYADMRTEPE
jgi:aryl-alcohol dehydrogenase-like predicted oxidoreductase